VATAIGFIAVWLPLEGASPTIPISIIVSVEAKHGKEIPQINREDVIVFQEHDRAPVKDWVPLLASQDAGLELFLLVDDSTDTSLGLEVDDLRKFIGQQPANTKVAVGYIRNGSVNFVQNLTNDHALAAKALRLPLGSASAFESPYTAIADLVKGLPKNEASREILLVSSGLDQLEPGPSDPYLDEAIDQGQRAGVQIYSIYAPPSGHAGHSLWRLNWAQSNLSRLADETGGEAYMLGFEMPVTFQPYLEQFAERLKHQYKLTFLAKPGKSAGYQRIRLETEVPNAELVAPQRVYIPR
jgi:hypothetical protein